MVTQESGRRRVADLARSEVLARPAVSGLAARLKERVLVARAWRTDACVVMVSLRPERRRMVSGMRDQLRHALPKPTR